MAHQRTKKASRAYYFYLLRCADSSLYAGIAKDPQTRLAKHNAGKGSAYVRSRGGGKIVYLEKFHTHSLALKREIAVKKMSRIEKLSLIKSASPAKNR
jgi:putative endonuclease